ncbi:hypothetical protein F5B20DRAFT_571795 [Whalleya microplaca]|nr:hypothetical protein F5B20DRAFT_571795 [Whalleya microplaca]
MSNTDNKSSELDRTASLRTSRRLSSAQGDDDDYDLSMGVADGFRPMELSQNHVSRPSVSSIDPISARVPPPRPSSTSKPHWPRESLTLRHDGSSTTSDSADETEPSRSSSASTESPFVDPVTPYEGPSGPSFPYQMYPQNVRLARTASLATTSTVPISERSYNGPRGPTHPYGMYPQNTVAEADGMANRPAQNDINVGFPGAADNYQRRIGPEGEEAADLIGPDGHTEQLPPYTRYPEETYNRKALGLETPQPRQAQPMLAIPGAGGIGMATRNPEFASTEDLSIANSPQSRQSVRSFTSDASQREISAAAALPVTDEKAEAQPRSWRTMARRKVMGVVPCWAIVLAIVVLLMMGIILGAVIGTVFSHNFRKRPQQDGPPSPAVTPSNWDTQPVATLPAELPPLPEGMYAMPLMNTRAPNTCFNDTTQAQAWNCNLIFAQLSMTIRRLAGEPNISDYTFAFSYNDTYTLKKGVYSYGMQPPDLTDVKLRLVTDVYESSRGPAWNFEIPYNKTVILPEPFLTPSTTASTTATATAKKRSHKDPRMFFGGDFKRKSVAQVGDKPWICRWDGTFLETFIYAGQNSSFSHPVESNGIATTSSSGDNGVSAATASPTEAAGASTTDPVKRLALRDEFKPSQVSHDGPKDHYTTPITEAPSVTTTSITPTSSLSSWFDKDNPMPPNPLSVYPRVLKVEERRVPGFANVVPVCRQYEIIDEYKDPRPALDANGDPIEVLLFEEEEEEDAAAFEPERLRRSIIEEYLGIRSSHSAKLANDMSDCGCMWWLT